MSVYDELEMPDWDAATENLWDQELERQEDRRLDDELEFAVPVWIQEVPR